MKYLVQVGVNASSENAKLHIEQIKANLQENLFDAHDRVAYVADRKRGASVEVVCIPSD